MSEKWILPQAKSVSVPACELAVGDKLERVGGSLVVLVWNPRAEISQQNRFLARFIAVLSDRMMTPVAPGVAGRAKVSGTVLFWKSWEENKKLGTLLPCKAAEGLSKITVEWELEDEWEAFSLKKNISHNFIFIIQV